MQKLAFIFLLLPALASAQYSGPIYNPANVKITGGTAAFTGTVTTTGNVNVQGNVSSTSNTQPASPTNSGVALNATPNIADVQMFDATQSVNNRTAEWIFFNGAAALRFANDAHSTVVVPFSVTGGSTGITGITSNSGSGAWAHTGPFSATSNITAPNIVANGGSIMAAGAPSTPLNVTTQSSVQAFVGGAANQATLAYINSTNTANNRSAYSQWAGGNFVIAGFANDAFTGGAPILQAQGGFATGITGILSNSGTGSWTHTGSMAVSGALIAGSGTLNVYSAAGVAVTTPHVVTGTVTLAGGNATATFTGNAVFSNTTSYVCAATNTSTNSAVRATNTSASTVTFNSGTTTDVIAYQCIGN
jgi:hypothetical protein